MKAKVDLSTNASSGPTLGEYARVVIGEQYRRLIKPEKKVLADKDPEALHQMRVSSRRLRTALQVFAVAVELPKAAGADRVRDLARVLGELRDLDVQTATLKTEYRPHLESGEQQSLDRVLDALTKQRRKTLSGVQFVLSQPRYQKLKEAYSVWLAEPRLKALAESPLLPLVPDLLSPLLSTLLLHPGWLLPVEEALGSSAPTLHELRKTLKHVRYEAEFFTPFYGEAFTNWVEDVRKLQDNLGVVQDTQVLLELLLEELPRGTKLPGLQELVQQRQSQAMTDWETVRQQHLDPAFRRHLRQLILDANLEATPQPSSAPKDSGPEDSGVRDGSSESEAKASKALSEPVTTNA
ncbi:CHAD domain-containing protein [Leptolyngbya sp. FACHB-261]|uniref:CHAD domain-containing protein n=1 Tax=Leptolyngbya sp. FACHB-261 TaxID=2692806 RepID=UPI001685A267|nr:CHAD domain-containing protein [Leptolyngbya sp. FACHB-261]MBD2101215.1 CHAD domain-containing protein [Leptolyngbya sp. FACHB-261]